MKYNFDTISRFNNGLSDHVNQTIKQVLMDLYKRGLLERFDGECIAASDILQHALTEKNIECRLFECQVSVINNDPRKGLIYNFIGFDNHLSSSGAIDTHVVVMIENDDAPVILDLSIAKTLGGSSPWVIEKLNVNDHLILGKYEIDGVLLTYHPKINPRLIGLHKKTLLERLSNDRRIEKNLSLLKNLVIMLMILVFVNSSRGAYDFYQTYVIDTNNWGPNSIIDEKID